MRRFPVAAAIAAALLTLSAAGSAPAATPPAKQPTALGTGGAAATVDPVATRAAINVLRRGGNAVDAAVTAAAVLGVVEPYSCRVSGMSVGVPGTVRAWETALREFGTISLRRALQPAIGVARRGFVVDPTFFSQTDAAKAIFADFPATAALYLDPDGTPRDVGTVIRNPDLARTYELIARQGPDAFYTGPLARAIVDTVQHPPLRGGATRTVRPGVMQPSDL